MKKSMKIVLAIFITILLLSLIFPTSPIRSWYSKYILSNAPVLSELGFNKNNCNYYEAVMFSDSPGPASISCITISRYVPNSDAQTEAINEMRSILEKNGWIFSAKDSWKTWDITYYKGARRVRIYPYDWDPSYKNDYRIIIRLQ